MSQVQKHLEAFLGSRAQRLCWFGNLSLFSFCTQRNIDQEVFNKFVSLKSEEKNSWELSWWGFMVVCYEFKYRPQADEAGKDCSRRGIRIDFLNPLLVASFPPSSQSFPSPQSKLVLCDKFENCWAAGDAARLPPFSFYSHTRNNKTSSGFSLCFSN